ncbi:MAG: hypothetical protein LBI06_06885, partial [Treponema sp.]|nr:hypothetical protein [Treponema sp.]
MKTQKSASFGASSFVGILTVLIVFGLIFSGCPEADTELPSLTGTVSISGTAQVGQTLTADTGS